MNTTVLSSTLLLTVLLAIGLIFFIKASVKDRTQVITLITEQPEESLLEQLQQYFSQRAYRVAAVDAAQHQVVYEGLVRPSLFLAIFLTLLAGTGILCLSLVLSLLLPNFRNVLPGLTILAPIAGIFYWQKAKRPEKVSFRIELTAEEIDKSQSLLTVIAHRDELMELQRVLGLKQVEVESA